MGMNEKGSPMNMPDRSPQMNIPRRDSQMDIPDRSSRMGMPERGSQMGIYDGDSQDSQMDMPPMPTRSSRSDMPDRSSQMDMPARSSRMDMPDRSSRMGMPDRRTQTSSERTRDRSRTTPIMQVYDEGMRVPQTLTDSYFMPGFLNHQIGSKVRVEFLVGTNAPLVDRAGTLRYVGSNYIIITPSETDDLLVCDLYSIKFVTIYQ
jgi:hypothetical protein